MILRLAQPEDAGVVAEMLRRLAKDLGDADFVSSERSVQEHGFGPQAHFQSILAERDGAPQGLALFLRHYSTTYALPGVYVQDLWVSPDQRGSGLGQRLLAAVAEHAARTWNAGYLGLTVNHSNPGAARFYARLGFVHRGNDAPLMLKEVAFCDLVSMKAGPA
ncbi:GNAT family N-acetyltransferase [Alisedimentitalea sp. MJ-SS2]|uniref:GNAT family N-acetyltransferase n=1 Tax=Aliisedimentitalea sp. MJ-SS2 TaxID=3049795 RepID=UPI002915C1D7|nr:GNAT family N-acetyltransferase [Alisedimentitalea sp. MJ-SS2]MDU8929370.1 GNAT family N-acetyltransferase [Alisedimentitalea sp. MJ-SS2]